MSRLSLAMGDIFSKLLDLSEKKLFTVSQNVLFYFPETVSQNIYYAFQVQVRIVCFFGSPYKHLFMNINTFISLLLVSFLVTYGSIFKKFFPSFWPDHSSPLIFLIYEGYLICLYKPQWNNRVYNWQVSFFIIF